MLQDRRPQPAAVSVVRPKPLLKTLEWSIFRGLPPEKGNLVSQASLQMIENILREKFCVPKDITVRPPRLLGHRNGIVTYFLSFTDAEQRFVVPTPSTFHLLQERNQICSPFEKLTGLDEIGFLLEVRMQYNDDQLHFSRPKLTLVQERLQKIASGEPIRESDRALFLAHLYFESRKSFLTMAATETANSSALCRSDKETFTLASLSAPAAVTFKCRLGCSALQSTKKYFAEKEFDQLSIDIPAPRFNPPVTNHTYRDVTAYVPLRIQQAIRGALQAFICVQQFEWEDHSVISRWRPEDLVAAKKFLTSVNLRIHQQSPGSANFIVSCHARQGQPPKLFNTMRVNPLRLDSLTFEVVHSISLDGPKWKSLIRSKWRDVIRRFSKNVPPDEERYPLARVVSWRLNSSTLPEDLDEIIRAHGGSLDLFAQVSRYAGNPLQHALFEFLGLEADSRHQRGQGYGCIVEAIHSAAVPSPQTQTHRSKALLIETATRRYLVEVTVTPLAFLAQHQIDPSSYGRGSLFKVIAQERL